MLLFVSVIDFRNHYQFVLSQNHLRIVLDSQVNFALLHLLRVALLNGKALRLILGAQLVRGNRNVRLNLLRVLLFLQDLLRQDVFLLILKLRMVDRQFQSIVFVLKIDPFRQVEFVLGKPQFLQVQVQHFLAFEIFATTFLFKNVNISYIRDAFEDAKTLVFRKRARKGQEAEAFALQHGEQDADLHVAVEVFERLLVLRQKNLEGRTVEKIGRAHV